MKISKAMTETRTNSTAPSERLLYLDLSSVSERLIREVAEKQISNAATANEQLINEKIQAKNKFNNKINIIKDIRNYYETEKVLSSIATTATSTSAALTGIGLPYSIPTAFATAKVCGSLPKTINTKIENKIKQFLRDIGYKQRGETKSNRSKFIRRLSVSIASPKRDSFSSESTVDDTNEEEEGKARGLTETDPNNLVERL